MRAETTQYIRSGPKTMETGPSMAKEWTWARERNENLYTASSTGYLAKPQESVGLREP